MTTDPVFKGPREFETRVVKEMQRSSEVMGSITTLLHDHWELTAFVRGLMVSIVFCGFSAGNVLSGHG